MKGRRRASAPRARARFTVVGIGASAGGLQALTELVAAVPAGVNLALVVVQHLEPGRESQLADLLGRAAVLPVRQLAGRTRMTRGVIYVAPPGKRIAVVGRELRVLPGNRGGKLGAIDTFFASLAKARGDAAIGVILSGNAHDGASGLEKIHAGGGATFAQDPATASSPSMPRAAIDTGAVDRILPPAEIGRALSGVATAPRARGGSPVVSGAMLERALVAIRSGAGIDLRGYKRATLARRLQRRLTMLGTPMAEYVERLEAEPDEARRLYGELLIHVSGFFRDESAYESLVRHVYPALSGAERADTPIRIWVPGCANGQEVYSIAISLIEHLEAAGKQTPVRIFGTDIDEDAVRRARDGSYGESYLGSVSAERLQRFFERHDGGFRVVKAVRSVCTFVRHDLFVDPPFSNLDLVSFRNVMIYLGIEAQKRALGLVHYALRRGGFLVVGAAESTNALPGAFAEVDAKQKIYRRRDTRQPTPDFSGRGLAATRAAPSAGSRWTAFDLQSAVDRATLLHHQTPGLVVDDDLRVVQFRGDTNRFVDHAPGAASLRLTKILHAELVADVTRAVELAQQREAPARRDCVLVDPDTKKVSPVSVTAIPITPVGVAERYYAILFEEAADGSGPPGARTKTPTPTASRLARELAGTRTQMREMLEEHEQALEQIRAGSDEVLSSNEELQSTNEELETAREELQSSYEELTTLNEELQSRNAELSQANNDLINVLATVDVAILMIDAAKRIRLFTPKAGEILNLIASDIGRPITDIRSGIAALESGKLELGDREVRDRSGRWYSIAVRPYTTATGVADGLVIALVDVDDRRRALDETDGARALAEEIVETVQQPLVVLDDRLAVRSVNRAFVRTVGGRGRDHDPARAVIDALQPKLDGVLENGKAFRNAVVEVAVDGDGSTRKFRASARRARDGQKKLLIVALDEA